MLSSSNPLAIVVTGASRGFGQALAIVANDSFQRSAKVILVARSLPGLYETLSKLPRRENCCYHSMDLSNLEELDSNIDILLKDLEEASRIILFQNAGTIGHLGPSREYPSLKDMQANINLNITSCLWLSSRITQYARSSTKELVIVNISSLVAIADFPTLGIYSAGKAAREKYHSLIAREECSCNLEGDAAVRTLNYAPGPLETDMVREIRANLEKLDVSLQESYSQAQLDPIDSARKIFKLLESDGFESGAHVDYYDLPSET